MVENRRQIEISEFLIELEKFLNENNAPLRFLDNVAALKQQLNYSLDDTALNNICVEVDNLLAYIGKKFDTGTNDTNQNMYAQSQAAMQQMQATWANYQNAFSTTQQSYYNQHAPIISETEKDMREMLNIKAHYEDVMDQGRFTNYFAQVETKFNNRNADLLKQCTQSLYQNGDNTIKYIYGVVKQTQTPDGSLNAREFYNSYERNSSIQSQQMINYADEVSKSSNCIKQFVSTLRDGVDEAIAKVKKKKTILLVVPFIALLLIGIVLIGTEIMMSVDAKRKEEARNLEQQTEVQYADDDYIAEGDDTSEDKNVIEQEIDYAKDAGMEIVEGAEDAVNEVIDNAEESVNNMVDSAGRTLTDTVDNAVNRFIQIVLFAFIIIFVIAYALYAIIIASSSKRWIRKAVAKILAPKMDQFTNDNVLWGAVQQQYATVGNSLNQSFANAYAQLVNNPAVQQQSYANQNVNSFNNILANWNNVKRTY